MTYPALDLMRREMRFAMGNVPDQLPDSFYRFEGFEMSEDSFIFVTPRGVGFHYRRGCGLVAHLPAESERSEFDLYLWGTVFGAVAWLNGLVPLHASAVTAGRSVVAFTADSGGGKSTLAAALTRHGFDHVCDDTLVVAMEEDRLVGLPDAKPLKLWEDALALAGAESEAPIDFVPGKHYARTDRKALDALPFTDLVFLERGEEVTLEPVLGARKLQMVPDALYRAVIHVARDRQDLHAQFMIRAATRVRFWILRRPFDPAVFERSVERIAELLAALPN